MAPHDVAQELDVLVHHPRLFTWESYLEMHSFDGLTADEIVANEFAKAEANWTGVRKLIQEDFTWNDGFIVEGDDILPHLVARDLAGAGVRAVFIGDHDVERIRNVVRTRGALFDEETDVEWALKFSTRLRSEADDHGFAWVDVEKNEHDLARVLSALRLSPQPGSSPRSDER